MRKIKFRGINNTFWDGVWFYGYLHEDNGLRINEIPIIRETVGQFTGLKDKNSCDIYEGDIYKTPSGKLGQVFFHVDGGWLVETEEREFSLRKINSHKKGEVVGNIYENPELL